MLPEILLLILLVLNTILHLKYILQIFQQNRYELRRLKNWLFLVFKKQKKIILFYFLSVVSLILLFFISGNYFVAINIILNIFLMILIVNLIKNQSHIIPLKITQRVIRQIIVYFLLVVISIVLSFKFDFILCLWAIGVLIYPWILLFLMGLITLPFEKMVHLMYMQKAKDILKKREDLIKIGITGSYGKTSTKNILHEILSFKYYSLMTPASFNTPMGITITIRNNLKNIHQVFICEMGADKVGEISELAKFVKPKYAVITSIGYQHLATFKNIQNIINEKMSLVENLPFDGVAVLNHDEKFINNYHIKNKCKIIWYSLNNPESDYQATNINYSLAGSSFIVKDKKGDFYEFKTKLLGKHNVANILAAIALGRELDISWEILIKAVTQIKQIKNRLEIKNISGLTFIDNSFNSNPVSVLESLDVLSKMTTKRFIITPGLIDLGPIENQENKIFGESMLNKVDVVILVGKKQTEKIYEGLASSGFNLENVVVVNTTKEAFNYVHKFAKAEDIILIENDLPDAFNW